MKGIGSDLIDIRRIDKTIARFGDRFKKRIFTDNEIKKCEKRKQSVSCYAKRFAAKEAAAKALGTGLRKGVYWRDLEIVNEPSGKPTLKFHGKSKNSPFDGMLVEGKNLMTFVRVRLVYEL